MVLIIKGLWRADGLDDDVCYSARRGGNVWWKSSCRWLSEWLHCGRMWRKCDYLDFMAPSRRIFRRMTRCAP